MMLSSIAFEQFRVTFHFSMSKGVEHARNYTGSHDTLFAKPTR